VSCALLLSFFLDDGRDEDTIYVHDNCNKAGSPLGGHLQKKKKGKRKKNCFESNLKSMILRLLWKETKLSLVSFHSQGCFWR
jgi:hypothetical protein